MKGSNGGMAMIIFFGGGFLIASCFMAKPTMIAWRLWQKQEAQLPTLDHIARINACTDSFTQIDLPLIEKTMLNNVFKLKVCAVLLFICELTVPGIPIVILLAAASQGLSLKRVLTNWGTFLPELKAYLKLIKQFN